MTVLETARLRLRPFRPDDFEDYAAMCADAEVMVRELGWSHVISLILPGNVRSIRVAERLGARPAEPVVLRGLEHLVYRLERTER